MPAKLFRSPAYFGIALIMAYIVMQTYSVVCTLHDMRLEYDVHLDYVAFGIHVLQNSVVDSIFIALAIWLFPIRDSKRLKSCA
jgi:predicted anti-sigma-YlaC factor YlaD